MPLTLQHAVDNAIVLCVDDNPELLECEKAFLEAFGYTVLTATSGSKALELASIHSIDIVIVDYFMHEMNGPEVAAEIKRLRPHAPVIMLSGSVGIPKQALHVIDAFVAKDCLGSHLLPTIAELQRGGAGSAPTRPSLYEE